MLTKKQWNAHWHYWSRLKAIMMKGRETWTKAEEDQRRHDFYVQAGCSVRSLTKFRGSDYDAFKKEALRILEPDNLKAQLDIARQANKRAMWRVRQLMDEMGKDDNFIKGVIAQMDNGFDPNTTDAWQRDRERNFSHRSLDELNAEELKDVIDALRAIKRREGRKVARVYVLK